LGRLSKEAGSPAKSFVKLDECCDAYRRAAESLCARRVFFQFVMRQSAPRVMNGSGFFRRHGSRAEHPSSSVILGVPSGRNIQIGHWGTDYACLTGFHPRIVATVHPPPIFRHLQSAGLCRLLSPCFGPELESGLPTDRMVPCFNCAYWNRNRREGSHPLFIRPLHWHMPARRMLQCLSMIGQALFFAPCEYVSVLASQARRKMSG
jgi:hypothetical protein